MASTIMDIGNTVMTNTDKNSCRNQICIIMKQTQIDIKCIQNKNKIQMGEIWERGH